MLSGFEDDLFDLIKGIQFRNSNDEFQKNLKGITNDIRKSQMVHVHSDKTGNLYKLSKDTYNQLLLNNITTSYRKTDISTLNDIKYHYTFYAQFYCYFSLII